MNVTNVPDRDVDVLAAVHAATVDADRLDAPVGRIVGALKGRGIVYEHDLHRRLRRLLDRGYVGAMDGYFWLTDLGHSARAAHRAACERSDVQGVPDLAAPFQNGSAANTERCRGVSA